MREVGAPQHVVDADLVAHAQLTPLDVGETGEHVAVDVLAREPVDLAREGAVVELRRAHLRHPHPIPLPQQLGQPPAAALGGAEHQVRVALEHPGPEHEPHRTRREPGHLGDVDAEVVAVLVALGRPGVGHDRHRVLLAAGPHRVVAAVVVGRLVAPAGRDHHRAQSVLLGPVDLGQGPVDVAGDRDERDAAAPLRAGGDQVGEPAVVGLGTGHAQLGVEVTRQSEACAEGNRGAALDRVRVGVHDLAGDTVGIEGLVAADGVPSASELVVVLVEPVLGELGVANPEVGRRLDPGRVLDEELVELRPVLLFEVGPVLLGRQPGVRVGGDDQVRVVVGGAHASAPSEVVVL